MSKVKRALGKGRYLHAINEAKRRILVIALRHYPTCRDAAKWLGVTPSTVSRDMRYLGIRIVNTVVVDERE